VILSAGGYWVVMMTVDAYGVGGGYGGVLHVCWIEHLVFFGGLLVVLRS